MSPFDAGSIRLKDYISDSFVLVQKEEKETKQKQPYLIVSFRNAGGSITGKIWTEMVPDFRNLQVGDPVDVEGEAVPGFPNKEVLEIKVSRVAALPVPHPVQEYINEICPVPADVLQARFDSLLKCIQRPGVVLFLRRFFTTACPWPEFTQAPAAMGNHHAYIRGLWEHSIEVAELVRSMAKLPAHAQSLDIAIAMAGAIVHDAGKVFEYDWHGKPVEMAERGRLEGHITIGTQMVTETMIRYGDELRAAGFTDKEAMFIRHIIASHHGKTENGSPVEPRCLEAMIVHYADETSAMVRKVATFLDVTPGQVGDWKTGRGGDFFKGYVRMKDALEAQLASERDAPIRDLFSDTEGV